MPKHVEDMCMNAPGVTVSTVTLHSVVHHHVADPAAEAANAGIDAGVSRPGALVAPGNDSLQHTAAHQRATGIPLQAPADISS